MKNLLHRFTEPLFIISMTAIIAVAAVAVTYLLTAKKQTSLYTPPTTGTIVQEVDATGNVKAATTVDLSFQAPGTISYIGSSVGAHVGAGSLLARLSGADLAAQVEQARAALAVQQAKLNGVKAGARPESIAVAQTAVSGAQTNLAQAKSGVLQASRDAYVKSDDAIHNKVDQFMNNPRGKNPSLFFSLSDAQLQSQIPTDRIAMEALLSEWQAYVATLPVDASMADVPTIQSKTTNYLARVSAFLDETAAGLVSAVPSVTYNTTALQGYQANIALARSTISGEVSTLNASLTQEKAAEAALTTAQSQLTLAQAPATVTDLEAQQAQVDAAQANLDYAQAQYAKTEIYAPIAGTVTRNDAHIGATATPGVPLISINSDSQFQMEVFVSQEDLAKLKVGNTAAITLDAYQSSAPLPAHVTAIDPAATVTNGIAAYKVTVQFDTNDARVQAGLTGTVKITAQTKSNAVSVPTSAVITRGNDTFVMKESESGDVMTPVVVGIKSADGMTEIISGITAHDRIRTFGNQ